MQEFATWLNNINIPAWLTPGSPTPFELGLRGIGRAINSLNSKGLPQLKMGFADFGENQLGMQMQSFGRTPGMENSNNQSEINFHFKDTTLTEDELRRVLADVSIGEGNF